MAKSDKKAESIPFLTPWLTARFPKISKPDTEGTYADGKYKTDGIFINDADIAPTRKVLLDAAKRFWPNVPEVELRLPIKQFFDKVKDGQPGEKTSAGWGLTLKSQYKPACFDAKKNKLQDGKSIGGGSELRVASAIFPWKSTEKVREDGVVKTVDSYGIGLRLNDTQVRKFVERSGSGDGSAFDVVEGYEFDANEAPAFPDDVTAF